MFADLDMSLQCGCSAPDIAQYGRFNPPAYVCSICGCNTTHLFDEGDRVDLHRKEVRRRRAAAHEDRLVQAGWRITTAALKSI